MRSATGREKLKAKLFEKGHRLNEVRNELTQFKAPNYKRLEQRMADVVVVVVADQALSAHYCRIA